MAEKKVIEVESNIGKVAEDVNKLAKGMDDVADSVDKVSEELKDTRKGVDDLGKTSKKSNKAIDGIAKGFKGVGLAIKAAGIGLVMNLLSSLKEVMMQNQAVADLFARAFETVSIVFNAFVQAIVDAVKYANEATGGFDALGKVLNGLLTLSLTPLKLVFYGIKLGIQEAMLAWEKSFLGNNDPTTIANLIEGINETREAIEGVADKAIEAGKDIAENIGEAVGELGTLGKAIGNEFEVAAEKAKDAWKDAGTVVDLRKQLEIARAVNAGLIEQYDLQAEKQRQIRDDDRKGISERIAANEKLGEVLSKQQKELEENARIAVRLAELEFKKNNTVENQVALQEAKNELVAIEAKVVGQTSEQLANQNALERELQEMKRTGIDAEREALKIIEEARVALYGNELERMREERRIRDEEFERRDEDIQNRIAKMEELGQTETQMYADLLAQRKVMTAEYNAYVMTSKEMTIRKELELEQQKQEAINGLATQGLQLLSSLAESGSETAKGLAAAQIIFDTYRAIQSTFATAALNPASVLFPAFPYIQAGLSAAFGAAQLRGLMSEQPPSGGGGTGSSVASAVVRPDINVVQANNANASLNNISNSARRPMRAYVTSGDVASAEALERNSINNAKIGG